MASSESRSGVSPMRSLERALGVLQVLEQGRQPLRLSEIARRAGLHIATTQRILGTLERFGYVSQGSLGFTIGVTSLLNSHAFLMSNSLSAVAAPVLPELAAAAGLNSSLAVRVGFSKVLIGRVEGSSPLRYQLPVGERMPLHLGSGRVLAAAMPEDELAEMLAEIGEIVLATGAPVTHAAFRDGLCDIRRQGYMLGYSERVLGAASIAVPIVVGGGEVVAALQLSGLAEHLESTKVEWYVSELKRAARAISGRLA